MKLFLNKKEIKTLATEPEDLPMDATPHVVGGDGDFGPTNPCVITEDCTSNCTVDCLTQSGCETMGCNGGSIPCYSQPCPSLSCATNDCVTPNTTYCDVSPYQTYGCYGSGGGGGGGYKPTPVPIVPE